MEWCSRLSHSLCLLILLLLVININGRGSSKKKVSGGNGNVLDNSYCLYAGNDCSSTCCIQQECATTLDECEYGHESNKSYLYYGLAGILIAIFFMPVLIKVYSTIIHFKLCTWKTKLGEYQYVETKITLSYLFWNFCCCSSKRSIIPYFINDEENMQSTPRFKSNLMLKLEEKQYNLEQNISSSYLKPCGIGAINIKSKLSLFGMLHSKIKEENDEEDNSFHKQNIYDPDDQIDSNEITKKRIIQEDIMSNESDDFEYKINMISKSERLNSQNDSELKGKVSEIELAKRLFNGRSNRMDSENSDSDELHQAHTDNLTTKREEELAVDSNSHRGIFDKPNVEASTPNRLLSPRNSPPGSPDSSKLPPISKDKVNR